MKKSVKAVIVIAVICCIVLILSIVRARIIRATQETSESAPVPTRYTDKTNGFEFEYPENWTHTRIQDPKNPGLSWLEIFGPADLRGNPLNVMQLLRETLDKGDTAESVLDRKLKMTEEVLVETEKMKVTSRSTTKVSGRDCPQAMLEIKDNDGTRKIREVVVPYGSAVLNFRLTADEDEYAQYEPALEQMLSTLKFTTAD